MNKKEVLQIIKIIVLGLILSVGMSYVFSATKETPTPTPPANNVSGPLNEGSANQAKVGGLAVGTATWPGTTEKLAVTGVTSTDALSVWYNSTLLGNVGIGGLYTTDNKLTVSGNTKVIGSMKITTLNPAPATESPVCVTATGQLQLCTP